MRKKQSFTVEKPDAGKRIDVFIHEKLPSLSRNQIKGIIQAGLLKRAYKTVANFGEKISENELIQIDYDPEENYKYRAKKQERKIEVVADTPDYIVFEKDFNVPSFSRRKNEKTAFQYINDYVKQKSNKRFNQVFPVVSPDKYIAGLMCVAKTESVQKSLSGNQQPLLRYLAVIEGTLPAKNGQLFHPERDGESVHFTVRKAGKKSSQIDLSTRLYELNQIIDFLSYNGLKLKFVSSPIRNKQRPLLFCYQIKIHQTGKKLRQFQVRIPDLFSH